MLRKPGQAVFAKRSGGEPPVVVIAEQGAGLSHFDSASGKRLVRYPADCASAESLEAADLSGDENWEVLCGNESGFFIYDLAGRLTATLPSEPESFAIVATPPGKSYVAVHRDDSIQIFTGDFRLINTLPIPTFSHYVSLDSAAATDTSANALVATLLGGRGGWHRTTLLIHQGDRLIYHEVLDGDFPVVRPFETRGFVLFGRGLVATYTFKKSDA